MTTSDPHRQEVDLQSYDAKSLASKRKKTSDDQLTKSSEHRRDFSVLLRRKRRKRRNDEREQQLNIIYRRKEGKRFKSFWSETELQELEHGNVSTTTTISLTEELLPHYDPLEYFTVPEDQ